MTYYEINFLLKNMSHCILNAFLPLRGEKVSERQKEFSQNVFTVQLHIYLNFSFIYLLTTYSNTT